MLKLLKTEKIKGKIRLYFICGLRLLKDYNEKHQLVTELTKTLTTGQALLIHQVVKMKQDKNEKERKYVSLFNQYAELLSKQLVKEQGKEKVFQIYQNHSIKELNILSEKLIKNGVEFIVLATKEENKLIISQNGNLAIHCGKMVKELAGKLTGKGGGNENKAQCSFPNGQTLEQFFLYLKNTF